MSERIVTLHPAGKQGVNIERAKYDTMRTAILAALGNGEEILLATLRERVEQALADTFPGSVGWYFTTVKLDLEAHGELERLPGRGPQRLCAVSGP